MIEQHRTPSTRINFPRSHREVTGYHWPSRPMQLYRPARDPNRIVWRCCAVALAALAALLWLGARV